MNRRRRWIQVTATFAAAALGGAGMAALGAPLAWLLGALLVVATLGLLGAPIEVPTWSRQGGQVIAGVAVGLYFTPTLMDHLLSNIGYMLFAAGVSIFAGGMLSLLLARSAKVDNTTAYFASLPGGVAEMSVLAERFGGDTALVALSQSLRIVVVVLTIPVSIAFFGVHGAESYLPPALPLKPLEMIGMLLAGFACAYLLGRIHMVNNWLLGGLVVGASVALLQLPLSGIPTPVVDVSQVLIGAALGARFRRHMIQRLRNFVPAAVTNTLLLIAFNVVMATVIGWHAGLDLATMVLANAPGGVAETSITAKTLHLGVAEVTAFHLVRILCIILLSAPAYRLARFAALQLRGSSSG